MSIQPKPDLGPRYDGQPARSVAADVRFAISDLKVTPFEKIVNDPILVIMRIGSILGSQSQRALKRRQGKDGSSETCGWSGDRINPGIGSSVIVFLWRQPLRLLLGD